LPDWTVSPLLPLRAAFLGLRRRPPVKARRHAGNEAKADPYQTRDRSGECGLPGGKASAHCYLEDHDTKSGAHRGKRSLDRAARPPDGK
jgi:hypothetical protein